jgi:hypothetical protein
LQYKHEERMKEMQEQGDKPILSWETVITTRDKKGLLSSEYLVERAKVPGGWLVISQFKVGPAHGLVYVPDPNHEWDGGSLP